MELKDLKESILSKENLNINYFIFIGDPESFLINQYIKYIVKDNNLKICEEKDLISYRKGMVEDTSYRIFKCEEYSLEDIETHNLIIITSKVTENIKNKYSLNIINFPTLEDWQIQDYSKILGKGIDKEDLDILNSICGNNIYRIDRELSKLENFSPTQRKYLFKDHLKEGCLDDVINYDIFTLTNALQSKDLDKIKDIMGRKDFLNVDPIAFLNILYQGFKKLILVWLSSNPTPENTGLKSNQIWAIKNIPHNYSKEQLINIFYFLTSLDCKIKSGELSDIDLINYIICKVLSFS